MAVLLLAATSWHGPLLLRGGTASRLMALRAVTEVTNELTIRPAQWPDDYEVVCAVRKPTTFVTEEGAVGFMGKRVELTPEVALERRVEARLGTTLRDNATVLIATDETGAAIGTVDCIRLEADNNRRAMSPDLPCRVLVRNVWVSPERRRQGLGSALVHAAEEHARAAGVVMVTLEVNWDNTAALQLYYGLGELPRPPPPRCTQ